ncbi:MAG TPA: pectate lyase [Candidatus Acidoferrales bacterium]|nr:pectate lyase [Candidatus Acidoferrales bacterium]
MQVHRIIPTLKWIPASTLLVLAAMAAALAVAHAEPVTLSRITNLPAAEQAAWKAYLERSQSNALTDAAVVQAEVAANNLASAKRAPSGGDFKLKPKVSAAWFAGDEAKQLADTILSFQTPSGGWSKHMGFTKGPRKPGMLWTSQNEPGQPAHYVATFDNASTTSEMDLLAGVWLATKREDCKAGFIKGLNFIFAAQYPNGGWPQVYPLEGGYHDDITYNDDAMTHVLELLQGVTDKEPRYAFVAEAQRQQAVGALAKGLGCVLKTQVILDGKPSVWCAQHDALTLEPAAARKMEPATLSGLESAHILKYLMTINKPTPEVVAGIEGGLKWFEAAKITGLAATKASGKTVYVADAAAGEDRWARFYDLKTGKPVFPGRDGVVYSTYAEMAAENHVGYDYYTSQPGSIVSNGQKKWRKMMSAGEGKVAD